MKKYKYPVILLCIGMILMGLPSFSGEKKPAAGETAAVPTSPEPSVQEELEQILKSIYGAGDVQVMLTISQGEKTMYQTDVVSGITENSQDTDTDTVIVSDGEGGEQGLVQQKLSPVYQGAIILCQGADSPSVRLAITQAVSKVTGLPTDRIAVLKMK
ncbi:MAG TPA: hypothetical protein IAB74_03870 [Candidatus Faecousia excrementigallinarum]|uniref:Stage III sporulation protein AG n=1 Tax=Candidatus Faecousia excrementigallinarum TaxID=2840806 RepID=A0A9D0Z1M3_9FIRM|nr:hypothetical protein [Candidatus Faecousia excrementigallinarum]